jgi:hypothetical protein
MEGKGVGQQTEVTEEVTPLADCRKISSGKLHIWSSVEIYPEFFLDFAWNRTATYKNRVH